MRTALDVRLLVTHIDDSLAFHRDAAGLPVLRHQPGGAFASFRLGATRPQLFDRGLMAEAAGWERALTG